mmetsp:Transcript_63946/g.133295  ORF Transcript_63946/g.133295 Transcript_63946/m.133295 type:complete len:414 (-) Transcript_63946:567-1808(-)
MASNTKAKPAYPKGVDVSTAICCYNPCPNDPHGPTSMPIYQSSTFIQPSATEFQEYDYTRSGNPTRSALETLVAGMDGADRAFAFTSGMAALSCMTRLLKSGDEILCNADIYGGMYRLLTKVTAKAGVNVKFVASWDLEKVRKMMGPKTKIVHIESPSNPLMMVTDIRKLAEIVHAGGALLTVDNTILSPVLMKPLELGADIVVHSATKFFGGHADVMSGFVCCKTKELSDQIYFHQNAEGTGLAPFDCWLVLRGVKTMPLRIERGMANCVAVANFLAQQPLCKKVHYAGVPTLKGDAAAVKEQKRRYELQMSQAKGAGVLLSFETGNIPTSQRFVSALKLFKITVSFGGCSSVVEMPSVLSHASIPLEEQHLPPDLVRMSVGIEDPRDLIKDITQALIAAGGPSAVAPSARL